MPLQLTLDSVEGLDDSLKTLYREGDDKKFHLEVDGLDRRTTEAVEAATKRANREAVEERKKRQQWEKLGRTADEIEAILEAQAKAEEDKATKAGEFDKVKAQIVEKHQTELKKYQDLMAAKDRSIQTYLIDSQATAAIAEAKGSTKLLLPILQQHLKVVEDNGQFQVRVFDAKGEPRVDKNGDPLALTEFVSELRASEDFGRAFDGTGHSGTGTVQANGGGASPLIKSKADLQDRSKRAEFVEKFGAEKYFALPEK